MHNIIASGRGVIVILDSVIEQFENHIGSMLCLLVQGMYMAPPVSFLELLVFHFLSNKGSRASP